LQSLTDSPSSASSSNVHQVVLSTAHPAKFSEAVSQSLSASTEFDFERDVLPDEFRGLLERPRRVIDVPTPEVALVKNIIIETLGKVPAELDV
jgi:threonine synthase